MTTVAVNTYAHSVTYVAENLLRCLQDVVRGSGLSPAKIAADWRVLEAGFRTWLGSRHLQRVILEVFMPSSGALVGRWDFDLHYDVSCGDGEFWVDTDQINFHLLKSGAWPPACDYRIVATNSDGRPDVPGWSATTLRSTDGFIRQSTGSTISSAGLLAGGSYYRKA